ncbi:MAG TPA: hypothetical protein DCP63_12505 [Bacteroidetes bacterium]|nr:hypothetical protein [Bacteroidota bacterium]
MIIAVVGHSTKDVFHLRGSGPEKDEQQVESLGGVFYSVATLANLLSKDDRILPVFGVGERDYESVSERLQRYGNVETKGIFALRGETNRVHFFPGLNGGLAQCSKSIAPPIPFARIKPSLDADAVLINMASGFDITLETLDFVRMHVRDQRIPLHFDFHSLTLGIDRDHTRFRRPLTDWRRWCFMMDSVQLNEDEAAGLGSERYDEPTLINHLMPLMVNALLITRGERGASLIRQEHKRFDRHDIEGVQAEAPLDTTGCGDVFGAAFVYRYVESRDYVKAAEFANKIAAIKTGFRGIDGLDDIRRRQASTVETG